MNDTLNQFNSDEKKHGYWIEHLNERFRPVKSDFSASYSYLVLYENGKRFHDQLREPNFFEFRNVTADSVLNSSGESPLLHGVYEYYSGKRDGIPLFNRDWIFQYNRKYGWLRKEVVFSNGVIKRITNYFGSGKIQTIVDYTDNYNSSPYSYSVTNFEETGSSKTTEWYILKDGIWSHVAK